jgi:dTDP-4-dehydrorhamnose reductase
MTYLVDRVEAYGYYHLSNDNAATWYDFAKEILKDIDVEVVPVTSEQFPQKAKRPQYSVLSLAKAKATGFKIPTWQAALAQMLTQEQL